MPAAFEGMKIWPDISEPARQLPVEDIRSRYYLRMQAVDRPGVLGQVATIFGRHDISISSVLQHEPTAADAAGVPVIITTYSAAEGNVRNALNEIDPLKVMEAPTVCIPIVGEYPETLE